MLGSIAWVDCLPRQRKQMRPQRQLARQIKPPPHRRRQRRRKLGLAHRRNRKPQPAPPRPPGSAAAAPQAAPGTPCAGSRAAPPDRTAHPPAPRDPARPQAAPPAGSHRSPPGWLLARAVTVMTAILAAFQPVQEPQPPLRIRQRDLRRPRLRHQRSTRRASAPAPCRLRKPRPSAATLGASNRLRIDTSTSSADRIRLISRVASSECPPSSKKSSSIPTRSTPSTSANSEHRIASCGVRGAPTHRRRRKLRRRQRPAVELAVRRQRQPIQHHDRRRHHVVRQHSRQRRPQRRTDRPPPPAPPPHSRSAAGSAGDAILPRHHHGLRHPGLPQQRRLDLARLDPEARAA